MHPTQTGIATALALAVIVFFFIFNGMSIFSAPAAVTEATVQLNQDNSSSMPLQNVTELQVSDEVVGTGAVAAPGDSVTVQYVGALANGTVFDASANRGDQGFTFTLGAGQVIAGWDQGLVGMREGGKRRLVIPASLAYGDRAVGDVIPANSVLVFEVELVKVEKSAQ